jgi:hypothetical protein
VASATEKRDLLNLLVLKKLVVQSDSKLKKYQILVINLAKYHILSYNRARKRNDFLVKLKNESIGVLTKI